MSFILDALRKAEDKKRDRHAISVPSGPQVLNDELPEAPPAERNSAWMLMLLGAVLASALWWFLQKPAAPLDTQTPAPAASGQAQITTTTPRTRAPAVTTTAPSPTQASVSVPRATGARALDREARRGAAPSAAPEAPVVASSARSSTPPSAAPTVTPGTVSILQSDGTSAQTESSLSRQSGRVTEETLPDYRQSLTTGEVPIPELHLDIHVYSAEPAKRFVFINLDKYAEGDAIDKNTTIESIEPEGAVINHKGFRFVLRPD